MKPSSIANVGRLIRKSASLAPIVAGSPGLLPKMFAGVHPEIYARLNSPWLRDAGIKTVLDIGANRGQFARTVLALIPDAKVYAFEPQRDTFEALRSHFAGSSSLHAINTAVGDQTGETVFHENTFAQSSSVLPLTDLHREAFPWAVESTEVRVPITTLDAIQDELELVPGMLIKIDVQGFEDRVLLGGSSVIPMASHVLIETAYQSLYEGEATFETVFDLMREYGFRFLGNLDQARDPLTGLPLYADALFVKE